MLKLTHFPYLYKTFRLPKNTSETIIKKLLRSIFRHAFVLYQIINANKTRNNDCLLVRLVYKLSQSNAIPNRLYYANTNYSMVLSLALLYNPLTILIYPYIYYVAVLDVAPQKCSRFWYLFCRNDKKKN